MVGFTVLFKMILESCPWGCWRGARQRWEAFAAATGQCPPHLESMRMAVSEGFPETRGGGGAVSRR